MYKAKAHMVCILSLLGMLNLLTFFSIEYLGSSSLFRIGDGIIEKLSRFFWENAWIFMLIALLIFLIIYILTKTSLREIENEKAEDVYEYLKLKLLGKDSEIIDEDTKSYGPENVIKVDNETIPSPPSSYQDENTDIYVFMMKNQKETTEYFKISKSQAKQSHAISLIACITGVVLLSIAILILLISQRVDLAIIPALSGAITEVVSGTVLWVYNKSSSQLNHYYDALHENERFLSVVNLVNKLSQDKQDLIYTEIIRSQLNYITIGNVRDKTNVDGLTSSAPDSNENFGDKGG